MRTEIWNSVVVLFVLCAASFGYGQGKAWRTITFGDSTDEVAVKLQSFDDVELGPLCDVVATSRATNEETYAKVHDCLTELEGFNSFDVPIGDSQYSVTFDFYDGKLYRVRFRGISMSAEYLGSIILPRRDYLVSLISKAVGPPDTTARASILDLRQGYTRWTHVWNTDRTGVARSIGIYATTGFKYEPVMYIEWTYLRRLHDQAVRQMQEQRSTEDSSDF